MNPLQWLVPWEASFAIAIVTAVTAIMFIRGSLTMQTRRFGKNYTFGPGCYPCMSSSHTQIDYYAEHEFFVHQLQSLVLHHLGPFFIVLACPKDALSAGLPMAGKRLIRRVSGWKPVQCPVKVLFHPVAAVICVRGLACFLAAAVYPLYRNARLAHLSPDELEHGFKRPDVLGDCAELIFAYGLPVAASR